MGKGGAHTRLFVSIAALAVATVCLVLTIVALASTVGLTRSASLVLNEETGVATLERNVVIGPNAATTPAADGAQITVTAESGGYSTWAFSAYWAIRVPFDGSEMQYVHRASEDAAWTPVLRLGAQQAMQMGGSFDDDLSAGVLRIVTPADADVVATPAGASRPLLARGGIRLAGASGDVLLSEALDVAGETYGALIATLPSGGATLGDARLFVDALGSTTVGDAAPSDASLNVAGRLFCTNAVRRNETVPVEAARALRARGLRAYDYVARDGVRDTGFLAQDVARAYPQAVHRDARSRLLSVDYDRV